MKRVLYAASTTLSSLAAQARRKGCPGEERLVSKWGHRSAVARVLVVGLLAGALFVTTPEGVQPAGASVSGPIMGIGAVCDGSGQMSGFWAWGMPIQSIFNPHEFGPTWITRAFVPAGATLGLSGSGHSNGDGNFFYGVQELGNGASIAAWGGEPLGNYGEPWPAAWTINARSWTNTGAARYVEVYGFLGFKNDATLVDWTMDITVSGGSGADGIDCSDIDGAELGVYNAAMRWGCPGRGVAADPVCTATGNFSLPLAGLSMSGRGPGLEFGVSYSARDAATDAGVGYGWSQSYGMRLVLNGDGTRTVAQENGATVRFFPVGSEWIAPRRSTATLVQDGTNWVFTRRKLEIFVFDSTGRLSEIRDRNGYVTSLSYDGAGQLSQAEDAVGRTLDFTWSGGRIATVADSRDGGEGGPRTIAFAYDAAGDLAGYTDAGGGAWAFTYDAHRLVAMRKPEHATAQAPQPVVTNHYDASGRIDWQDDELGRRTEFHYDDPVSGATRVVFPDGDQRVDYYDGRGLRTKVTVGYGTPEAVTTDFMYDPVILAPLTSTVDGLRWTYSYDLAGNRVSVRSPIRETWSATFNALDLPVTITEPVSGSSKVTTTFTYDTAGNVEKVDTPLLGTSAVRTIDYQYGDTAHPGDVTAIVDERSKTTALEYDAAGNVVRVEDPLGNVTTWAHNSLGWVTSAVAPEGNALGGVPANFTTSFAYDDRGAVVGSTGPGGTINREFDAGGRLILMRDQAGKETSYDYDAAGQLVMLTRPDTSVLTNEYWDDGSLRAQIDAADGRTEYDYDAVGHLVSTADPLGRETRSGYDARGRVVWREAPGGDCSTTPGTTCTRYVYYDDGTLQKVDYSGTTPDVTYTYWESGRPKTMVDGQGTTTWTWDSLGRMVSEQAPGGNCAANPTTACTKYGYAEPSSFATTITYPGNKTVTRVLDDAGRMQSVTDWLSNATGFSYDSNGNVDDVTFPASTGNVDSYEHDDADRVAAISMAASSSTLADLAYTRDARGLVESITGTGMSSTSYGYDDNGRLTHQDSTETWAYDGADNLTQHAPSPGARRQVFDAANQLCFTAPSATAGGTCATPPPGATSYAYDLRGNRISSTVEGAIPTTYGYDEADRLTSSVTITESPSYAVALQADQPYAWWRLGEASGTTAADATGGGRDGTYTNSPTLGVSGALSGDTDTAVALTGSPKHVALPNGFNWLGAASGFTIEGWAKPTTAGNWARVVEFGTGQGTNNVFLSAGGPSGNDVAFGIWSNGGHEDFVVSRALQMNTWQHLAITFAPNGSGGGTALLYRNGALIGTRNYGRVPASVNYTQNSIGKSNFASDAWFKGSLDEVSVYPAPLPAARIAAHYLAANPELGTADYSATVGTDLPISRWRLDETSGAAATDSGASGQHGTYTNSPSLGAAAGIAGDLGASVTLNGSNQYVALPNGFSSLGSAAGFTIEGWVRPTGAQKWARLVEFGTGASTNNVLLTAGGPTGNDVGFSLRSNGQASSPADFVVSGALQMNVWQHLAVTFTPNGTGGGTAAMYKNGAPLGMQVFTITAPAVTYTQNAIGKSNWSADKYLKGSVDEVAVYSSPLPSERILAHYQAGSLSRRQFVTATYYGDGLRASKTGPDGTITRYVWERSVPVPQLLQEAIDAPGTTNDKTVRYVYGPGGGVIEDITSPATGPEVPRWYHRDHLGSVRLLTDASGVSLATFTYGAFGQIIGQTGNATTPFGFAGQYRDAETGFTYLRARYYDPATGQFLTRDPLGAVTGTPYAYAANNPVNLVDPTGDIPILLAGFIGGALVGGASDIGMQMLTNAIRGCDPFDMNWRSVATSAFIGGVVGGATAGIGKALGATRAAATEEAGAGLSEAFHYTASRNVASIEANGLRAGSYATPNGQLSPLQAQIDLALSPNRGLPSATLRVDVAGLREAGYEIPRVTQVGRSYNMPGGGYEMQFPFPIPPEFIKVVP